MGDFVVYKSDTSRLRAPLCVSRRALQRLSVQLHSKRHSNVTAVAMDEATGDTSQVEDVQRWRSRFNFILPKD